MKANGFEMIKVTEMTKERVNPNIFYARYYHTDGEYYTPIGNTPFFDDDFEFPEKFMNERGRFGVPYQSVHGEDILKSFYKEEEDKKQYILEELRRVQRLKEERLQREKNERLSQTNKTFVLEELKQLIGKLNETLNKLF
jgi:hypothetical protein